MSNLNRQLSKLELHDLGFTPSTESLPRLGAKLILYHKVWGLTFGYYVGKDYAFLLPLIDGYNWASHWRYHS